MLLLFIFLDVCKLGIAPYGDGYLKEKLKRMLTTHIHTIIYEIGRKA
jgi:hypothetical protein